MGASFLVEAAGCDASPTRTAVCAACAGARAPTDSVRAARAAPACRRSSAGRTVEFGPHASFETATVRGAAARGARLCSTWIGGSVACDPTQPQHPVCQPHRQSHVRRAAGRYRGVTWCRHASGDCRRYLAPAACAHRGHAGRSTGIGGRTGRSRQIQGRIRQSVEPGASGPSPNCAGLSPTWWDHPCRRPRE